MRCWLRISLINARGVPFANVSKSSSGLNGHPDIDFPMIGERFDLKLTQTGATE